MRMGLNAINIFNLPECVGDIRQYVVIDAYMERKVGIVFALACVPASVERAKELRTGADNTPFDYKQVRKRLRGKEGQQIITTFNPIKETHWIKKEVFDIEKWHDVPMEIEIAGRKIPSQFTAVKSIRMNEAKMILNPRTKEIDSDHSSSTTRL